MSVIRKVKNKKSPTLQKKSIEVYRSKKKNYGFGIKKLSLFLLLFILSWLLKMSSDFVAFGRKKV